MLVARTALLRDADVLGLGEEAEGFFAAFAADTALFHAAEGNAEIANEPAIYPDGPGMDFFGNPVGAVEVLGPDTRGQAVFVVVRVTDHFVLAVERRDGDDRAEDFFAVGPAGNGQIGQDGRWEKIAFAATIVNRFRRLPAENHFAAFLLREA